MKKSVIISAAALVALVAVAAVVLVPGGDDPTENALKETFSPGDFIVYTDDDGGKEQVVITEVYGGGEYQIASLFVNKEFESLEGLRSTYDRLVTFTHDVTEKEKKGSEVLDTVFGKIECTIYQVTEEVRFGEYTQDIWVWDETGLTVQMAKDDMVRKVTGTSFLEGDRTPGFASWVPLPKDVGEIPEGLKVDTPRTEVRVGDWYEVHTETVDNGVKSSEDVRTEVLEVRDGKVRTDSDDQWITVNNFLSAVYIPDKYLGYAKTDTSVMDTPMGDRVVTKYINDYISNDESLPFENHSELYLGEDGLIYKKVVDNGDVKTTVTLTSTNLIKNA